MAPRGLQDAPKTALDASKTAQDSLRRAQDPSKTPQDASKTAQDASQTALDASKTGKEASQIRFLVRFGRLHGDNLAPKSYPELFCGEICLKAQNYHFCNTRVAFPTVELEYISCENE